MFVIRPLLFLLAILSAASLLPARAQHAVETEYAYTRIIPEANGFVPGETLWVAVSQEIRPGWHVFWVNPGDAGLPLDLTWSLPDGFETGAILHPAPHYIPVGPLASYAHEGAPVFLVPVTAPAQAEIGAIINIEIKATWQACEEICVPEAGSFSFSLPVLDASARKLENQDLFARARAALPPAYEKRAKFYSRGEGYILELPAPDGFRSEEVFFFPAIEGLTEPAGLQSTSISDSSAEITIQPGYLSGYDQDTLDGVLTFVDANGERRDLSVVADIASPIANPLLESPKAQVQSPNIMMLIVLAFFGGLILNVMPCVFPIIFVKAAALMHSAKHDQGVVRRHGLLYSAGVVATFLAIGGLLLALRAGGQQLGWGFHLQSPPVVALSAYVLLLVGLNLSGLFTIGESITGAGDKLAGRGGDTGAFFTGALAVVVAAPCIGPLLSAPMGAALLLPAAAGILIFIVLGLGLAAPYLALSFVPALGRYLPNPGAWMKVLKQALAFPVFAAAAYFLWVIAQQSTGAGLAVVLAGAVFLSIAAWAFELSKSEGKRAFFLRIIAALAALAAIAPLLRLEAVERSGATSDTHGAVPSEAFSIAALERYRLEGRPVFVVFTAAWCVTCQIDKVNVFSNQTIAAAIEENGAAFMVADWTVRDQEITQTLETFGASGVPFYVYYPASGAPKVLTIPITRKAVLETLSGGAL